jgi:RNA polymerase sigma-70 factor (ECF subfamily)
MSQNSPDTDRLLDLAEKGDRLASDLLLERHRPRLRRMAAMRLDPRLSNRVDPSDIVQETLVDAYRRLPDYLRDRPLPFYPWLRSIAWNRLIDLHRRHIQSVRRTVTRETPLSLKLSQEASEMLVTQLTMSGSGPLEALVDDELRERLHRGLESLSEIDREVLVLRHLESFSVAETAAVLDIAEGTVKSRHFRALERLRGILSGDDSGEK